MPSQNDTAWQRYLDAKGYTLDGASYLVDADELKILAGREPRLLAKFDEPNQLPAPFVQTGYTLLPIRNGRYILFPGNVFVPVSSCSHQQPFMGQAPFRLETISRGNGESQYVDQAYIIGLLSDFVGVPLSDLFLTIRGRERTRAFDFAFANAHFRVDGVQIEVDAGYEGPRDIILVEAKIGVRSHFNVRQLYYPFRHFAQLVPNKRVRPVFLAYDLAANQYHLHEIQFRQPTDPGSWYVARCRVYQLQTAHVARIDELIDVRFATWTDVAPQADNLNRIAELLDFIDSGLQTPQEVADAFAFDPRQSNYYREAAEYLGLVNIQQGRYSLTSRGQEVVLADVQEKRRLLAYCIINSWIFAELIDRARRRATATFSVTDIEHVIASVIKDRVQRYTSSTIPRRRQTIVAWIRWLSEQFGCFEAHGTDYEII